MGSAALLLPATRLERWLANTADRHGALTLAVADGVLTGRAVDGSTFTVRLPFGASYDGPADPRAVAAAARPPEHWGVLLVRKGGFAVARLAGERLLASKTGRRHVQGRSKAGGQSQQRFARRRDGQAREAYRAAADAAASVLADLPARRALLVAGGDRAAVAEVLADPRLAGLVVGERWLAVPEPRRAVLDAAIGQAAFLAIAVENADDTG